MEGYKTYLLGEIAEMKYGKLPPESVMSGKYPIYSGYRYVGYTNTYNCNDGDVIVVARGVGGTGDVRLLREKCFLTNLSILIILNKEICNPAFFYYKYQVRNLRYLDSGSAQSQITIDDLKRLEITLPSLAEQNRIVSILQSLDEKIALNKRINHNLEKQAYALFKSWFVDYEPFKDGEFVDSEVGLIPKGWQVIRFNEFVQLSNERVQEDSTPEYSVTNNGIFPREVKFNKQLSSSPLKNKVIRKGNLVFGMSREILNWGIMKEPIGGVSSAYTVYNVNELIINPIYLELYIKTHTTYFMDLIKPAAREGQGIDKNILASKFIILPRTDVWRRFLLVFDVLNKELLHKEKEVVELIKYRDELLPALINGQLSC